MPELPEVETIRRGLEKVIIGKRIEKFESRDSKVVRFEAKDVEGMYISNIERRAKILIFYLTHNCHSREGGNLLLVDPRVQACLPAGRPEDDKAEKPFDLVRPRSPQDAQGFGDKALLCHLKMTGQLIWEEKPGTSDFQLKKSRVAGGHPTPDWVAKLPNNYTRAIFTFDDKSVLFFNDLRRFGYMKLYDTKNVISTPTSRERNPMDGGILKPFGLAQGGQVRDDKLRTLIPELSKLGPEPFSNEFTVEYLIKRASKIPNRKIKQFITDQEIISGVGNIYVDEALFYAGVLPTRPVREISLSEWNKIKDSIIKALELGLKYGGSSEDTYVDAFGNQGTMNEHCNVYRRTGRPCQRDGCNGIVKRITLGGRGTHFCEECQH